jgi:hypothetical protein
MESKGLATHSPRSPFYDEILACYPHAVYPLDFSRPRHVDGLVFFWLLLGHMNMESKGCSCIAPEAHSTAKH